MLHHLKAWVLFSTLCAAAVSLAAPSEASSTAPPSVTAQSGTTATASTRATSFEAVAGRYYGHTRSLRITARGRAKAVIYDGCCAEVSDLRYRLTHLRHSGSRWTARATITRVVQYDPAYYDHPPRKGQRFRLRVRNDVAHLAGVSYCGPSAPVGYCGA